MRSVMSPDLTSSSPPSATTVSLEAEDSGGQPLAKRPRRPPGPVRARRKLPDEIGIFIAFLAIFGVLSLSTSTFAQPQNLLQDAQGATFYGVMALGMTFALSLGEIDISVGSGYYLTAVVVSQLLIHNIDPWIAALVGLLVGTALGFLNGVVSLLLRIPVLIVTIGTLSLYAGLGLVISDAEDVTINNTNSSFFKLVNAQPGGVPAGVIMFVFLMVCAHVLLQWTRFGYRVQATGSNPEAAVLAGIATGRTRLQVMSIVGFTVGLTGVFSVGYFEAVDASVGTGYSLLVLSAVIIGGTALNGGWGTIVGTTLGILILAEINTGIVYLGISANYSQVVTGAMILIAVGLDRLVRHPGARQAAWRRLRGASRVTLAQPRPNIVPAETNEPQTNEPPRYGTAIGREDWQ